MVRIGLVSSPANFGEAPADHDPQTHMGSSVRRDKTAWLADYRDQSGKRRSKQFARKKDAEAYLDRARTEVRQGTQLL